MPSTPDVPRVVFAHGKESGPWGRKIQHLADDDHRLAASLELIGVLFERLLRRALDHP